MSNLEIKKTACLGAGMISSCFALLFSQYGYGVNIYDVNPGSYDNCDRKIRSQFAALMASDVMTEQEVTEALGRITYVNSVEEAVRDVQFIQESILEDLDAKHALLEQIDQFNTTAIYASSTGSLNITDIAANSRYPGRCVGGHPYNPPHLIPLVEMTQGEKTDPATVDTAYRFYQQINREPVKLLKESPGFIGNRLQMAYLRESLELIKEGVCSVEDLEKASVYGLGLRWAFLGPLLNFDVSLGGGSMKKFWDSEVGQQAFESIANELGDWTKVPRTLDTAEIQAELNALMMTRPAEQGINAQEIYAYRDRMVIEALKLHRKL